MSRTRTRTLAPALLTAAITAAALTGCASGSTASEEDDRIQVVASTNVYGSIAEAIGGDAVTVTSIIDSAAQDPHSYEATARDRLALSRADLVIQNGGGYDPFISQLLGDSEAVVVDAVEVSGVAEGAEEAHDHAEGEEHAEEATPEATAPEDEAHAEDEHAGEHAEDEHAGHDHIEGVNEHVWYDVHAMEELAHEIAHELGAIDEANAEAYETAYDEFATELDVIHERIHGLEELTAGKNAAITEPVPLYMLTDAGLGNATPEDFSEAIEEGTDVPPVALRDLVAAIEGGEVALLAYNSQTSSPETEQVREAAENVGIPVVDFAETLPEGSDYLGWMTDNVDRLEESLAG